MVRDPPFLSTPDAGELQGAALTRMALQTLAQFTFVPHTLLDFIRDHVIPCLDNPDPSIRKAAVVAACHGIEDHVTYRRRNGRRLHSSELRIVDKVWGARCRSWTLTRRRSRGWQTLRSAGSLHCTPTSAC